ncbi:MAG TPA: Dyp-type peroxidase [Pyrinomonadaceae bacterium]|jgi:deferrochelatase/peroxidase EfeB|nr:Dyp-type peroxidase [Pyrinomonadaceae bacterium]
MNDYKTLPKPLPFFDPPYQSGISDPHYPLLPPPELEDSADYNLYKGLVDLQSNFALIRANVFARDAKELQVLLRLLSRYAYEAMEKEPSRKHLRPLEFGHVPKSYRVTVTIGFGPTLFIDRLGFDRYGLSFRRPKYLKIVPSFPGDEYDPSESVTDLIISVASDHPYVNVAISRYIAEYINKTFCKETGEPETRTVFKVVDIQQGFSRPDQREFLRFNDGIDNVRVGIDLEKLVFVDENCGEPWWCIGGSYMVYRKIREMMPVWEAFSTQEQEHSIGREKESGKPLSRQSEGIENLTPVYPDPRDASDGPLNAHVRKVQPRRSTPDLFGVNDLERRFLRRGYPFFDGVDEEGKAVNGLHFVAYMKSILQQFEHVTNMWQMNPDFPQKGTGIDALFAKGVLKTISGGYYFCPPAPENKEDFIGSGLFKTKEKAKYDIPAHIYGYGISFFDIDETILHTFAQIKVLKDEEIVRVLDNQQFNDDTLAEGESYDFEEFKDAEHFLQTSKPIMPVIRRLKKMLSLITAKSEGSRIVFLTARSDFDNKDLFLNTFRKYGIDIDSKRMYVERSGNLKAGTVAGKKKEIVTKYLATGKYRRVRLIDDNKENLTEFLSIKETLPNEILTLIRKTHSVSPDVDPIEFSAYLVNAAGDLQLTNQ